jgi:hypothetical protein
MISKAFQLGRRLRAVRLAVCAAIMISLLAPLSTVPAYAAGGQTGGIQGTVIDAASKVAISGAKVNIAAPTGNYSTTTGSNGFFSFLGVTVDTYTLSIQYAGYDTIQQSGITVTGDQTLSLGNVPIAKTLRTIVRTTSRALNGAFQPTQTIDSYTISGARLTETTGKSATTNENNLLLAVPGVTLTNAGSPTIRGGAAHEVGYQYDGVTFTEPFLANNGGGEATGSGLFNGIGNVQVVEGAGDATQGNVGSGVINLVPKRGSYPSFGYVDAEMGGPNYFHQFAFEYGFASRNDTFSDYIAYNGQRYDPYHGYFDQNAAEFGNYFGTQYRANDQFVNNFVFKFGKNHNQSLQALYSNLSSVSYGNYGGLTGLYSPSNPNGLAYYPYDVNPVLGGGPDVPGSSQSLLAIVAGYTPSEYAQLIALSPNTPGANLAPTSPQIVDSLQTRFLKFEYDNNISPTTYLALRYYNWEQLDYNDASYSNGPAAGYVNGLGTVGGVALPSWQQVGGPTVGTSLDLTQQFGSKLTVTANGQYNIVEPTWNSEQPGLAIFGFGGGSAQGPSTADWLPSANLATAPNGYIYNYFCGSLPQSVGIAFLNGGPKPSCLPRLPSWGIDYEGDKWQNYGIGLRVQYAPVNSVRLDAGLRYEGQNEHWTNQLDQYNQFLFPREYEPRAGLTWEVNPATSVRFGYGRSAVFSVGQNGGTPFYAAGLAPYLNVPAPAGYTCGIFNRGAGYATFPCKSYGAALYWAEDNVESPDAGNTEPAIYSNYDISIAHQFKNGFGVRVTPFYKLGTTLPTFSLITVLPGGNEIFGTSNLGLNRTTGLEFNLTSPEHPYGVSGFFSATYQNVLSTTPPLSIDETAVPLLAPATLALGDIYRAGYVSPFSMRIGGTMNTKSGFSATPVLQFNVGYPYSLGNLIAGQLSNGSFNNIPQVNFGPGLNSLTGLQSQTGTQLSTNYYDPADPGTSSNPNIGFTRGTPATSATGGYLSHYNLTGNLTLQYKRSGNTFGIQMANLFGNAYINTVPAVNPFYQPVATGLSGPLNNVNTCTATFGSARGCANFSKETYAFQNGAYLQSNGDFTAGTALAPLTPFNITLYYQRAL